MSGSAGGSKSDSGNQSGFSQDVWGGQTDALGKMYGQAGDLMGSQMGADPAQGNITQGINDQMAGGAYKDMGLQDQLMGSIRQSQNTPSASQDVYSGIMGGSGNTSLGGYTDSLMQQGQDMKSQNLGMLDARAAASGMDGSSPYSNALSKNFSEIDKNTQMNIGSLGFNAFDKDLDRKLGIAQQADTNNLGRQQLMGGMLGQQQGAMQGGVQSGMNYQNQNAMQPWNQMGAYSNAIGGPTVLSSGSGSGSSNSKGAGSSAGGK